MPNGVYNRGKFLVATKNLASLQLYLCLVSNTYTFSNTHDTVANLEGGEIVGGTGGGGNVNNYVRTLLANVSVTEDDTNHFAYLYADNVTFSTLGSGNTIHGAVLVANTGGGASNANCELIAFYDITDTPTNGGDITIQWANTFNGGVLKLS